MVQLVSDAAGLGPDDFACGRGEALGARSLDKGLGCGDEAGEVAELREGADLSICENRPFPEDGEAMMGKQELAGALPWLGRTFRVYNYLQTDDVKSKIAEARREELHFQL